MDGPEWITGDLNHIEGKVFIFCRAADAPMNSPDWFEVDPTTVCQFTGLKDKKGTELFHKDIGMSNAGTKFIILWVEDLHGFYLKTSYHTKMVYLLQEFMMVEFERIGNYFDNPNLISDPNVN